MFSTMLLTWTKIISDRVVNSDKQEANRDYPWENWISVLLLVTLKPYDTSLEMKLLLSVQLGATEQNIKTPAFNPRL